MTELEILEEVKTAYQSILSSKLVGIYVHGSIAFGCFRWDVSDIDFLVVVNAPLEQYEKEAMIQTLLELDPYAPPKGLEMSVVLDHVCSPFQYPTPFELHFSNAHKQRCRENLTEYCRTMNGVDSDLAAHFTVIHQVGQVLYGKPIQEVFAPVPKEAYLDSILGDIGDAEESIRENPVYYILNLCRVLAFLESGRVLSKAQGGHWGMEHLPEYAPLIQTALNAYTAAAPIPASAPLIPFTRDMLARIHQIGDALC